MATIKFIKTEKFNKKIEVRPSGTITIEITGNNRPIDWTIYFVRAGKYSYIRFMKSGVVSRDHDWRRKVRRGRKCLGVDETKFLNPSKQLVDHVLRLAELTA